MTPPRPKPDGSRVTQVRILPIQEEPSPFADLPDITPDQMRLIFAFAGRKARLDIDSGINKVRRDEP